MHDADRQTNKIYTYLNLPYLFIFFSDTILPCAHAYCMPCIAQWNVDHKTCPVCRETLSSTDEGWVISDGPDALEIATDIQKSLMSLTR
jgi:RNA polymerase subunit RPABC4/transcription elongation factor Spt4